MSLVEAVTPIEPCPACGCALDVQAMPDDRQQVVFATCLNPACDLSGVTLPLGEHERLSVQEIAGYRRVNLRFRASRAAFAARESGRVLGETP